MIEKLLKVGHLIGLHLDLHHYIITDTRLNVNNNIYIKKTMSEKNKISIFPQSKQNLHPESMPDLGKFSREPREITQNNHMPRKGFRTKRL